MLGQLNIFGKDKVETAIERIKAFEPEDGYYLAFSGGKDSVTVKALCDMAGVKYDAHYSVTSVDPPELVEFVKTFPDVEIDIPTYKTGGGGGDDVESYPEKIASPNGAYSVLLRFSERTRRRKSVQDYGRSLGGIIAAEKYAFRA